MATGEPFNFQKWIHAFETKDLEGMLAAFSDDVEIYSEDREQPIRGKETLRQFAQYAFPAMGEVKVNPLMVVQKGDQVAALFEASVRYNADLNLPGGVHLPVAGKSARLHGSMFATLNEAGQIVWMHRIRDTASAMKQLGLRPEDLERAVSRLLETAPRASTR